MKDVGKASNFFDRPKEECVIPGRVPRRIVRAQIRILQALWYRMLTNSVTSQDLDNHVPSVKVVNDVNYRHYQIVNDVNYRHYQRLPCFNSNL